MADFGKTPPRSLRSFGVSGILDENCEIFYSSVFNLRHIGRISDLLAVRLKELGADELRLRAALLFGAFEAYRGQSGAPVGERAYESLSEPLVVECGADGEKIAVGIAFSVPDPQAIADLTAQGLKERIESGKAGSAFERILSDLLSHSHHVYLRIAPPVRKLELVSVIGVPGRIPDEVLGAPGVFECVVFENSGEETPKARSYVDLGDLDYPRLLGAEAADSSGTAVVSSKTQAARTQKTGESAALENALHSQVVAANHIKERNVVSGVTEKIARDVIHVKGGSAQVRDETVLHVGSSIVPAQEPGDAAEVRIYQERIQDLENKIAELELARATVDQGTDPDEEDERGSAAFGELIKRIWPFSKRRSELDEDESLSERDAPGDDEGSAEPSLGESPGAELQDEGAQVESSSSREELKTPRKPPTEPVSASNNSAEAASKSLVVEIQAGSLDRTIMRAQREAGEIKKELGSARAKRWVDGLMQELVSEKSRLQELAKKLNTSVRQKEMEFRNREMALKQELRRRDEMVKQKNVALSRSKEQLAQLTLTMERNKGPGAGGSDDGHFKQKYTQAQKLLVVAKEENILLKEKVEELKSSLAAKQLAVATHKGPSFQEYQSLRTKHDRLGRQLEEYKRQNQILLERLNEKDKKDKAGTSGGAEDFKKKLESAMKLVNSSKKESERLTLKLEEAEREETRLKRELQIVENELQTLKNRAKSGNGGSGAAA